MKKVLLTPLAVLTAILALSLWNSAAMTSHTDRWRDQLQQVSVLAEEDRWPEVQAALADSYQDWSAWQTYLHIVSRHDVVDDAEVLYQRCAAFAALREDSEFNAELTALRQQLQLLAEMERFSIKNTL